MKTGFAIFLFLPSLLYGFKTCCKEGEVLNIPELPRGSFPKCVINQKNTDSKKQLLGGQTSSGVNYPTCTEFEYFAVAQINYDTSSDTLKLQKYREPIPTDRYCIDATTDNKIVAVTCNQCKEGKLCINTCCPFGMTFNEATDNTTEINEFELPPVCIDDDFGFELDFFSPGDEKLEWKEGEHFILVGPTQLDGLGGDEFLFNCPIRENPWYPPDSKNMKLDSSGTLHVTYLKNMISDYPSDTHCVFNKGSQVVYATCTLEPQTPVNNYCEDVRQHTFNVGFVLSIIFIIMSIIAHFVEDKLYSTMFGKMSVVYLFNMLGQFLVIITDRFIRPEQGTTPCVLFAYFKQYFNLSFFFSINILAIICYNKVSEMNERSKYKIIRFMGRVMNPDNKSFLWKGILYVQGIPLLISLVTLVIDQRRIQLRNEGVSFDTTSYPEAGEVSCYMSYQKPDKDNLPSYFITPEFIYVQSFQSLLLLSNIVLFCMTVYVYLSQQITPDNKKAFEQKKENFKVMAKLFFIMICTWIFEIVTSAISAEYGINETCIPRFILDVPNAFFGLWVFLVMVCSKPPVVKSLRQRSRRFISTFTGSTYVPSETSKATTG